MIEPPDQPRESGPPVPPPGPAIFVAPVVRLRPIRTLVIARDLAFRRRAVTVLVELGHVAFAMVALDDCDEVLTLVERQRADVVVLDATGLASAIGPLVSVLHDAAPRVGVVVVADLVDRAIQTLVVVPKWGWAADLSGAVRDAYRLGNPLKEELSDVRN